MTPTADMEPLVRLDRDLRDAARLMSRREARYIVDQYYTVQEYRKSTANQSRSLAEGEPGRLLGWAHDNMRRFEDDVRKALDAFTDEWAVGRWMKSIVGVAEVISAGFLSRLDVRRAPTAGHFWRYCGLDPSVRWASADDCERWVRDELRGGALNHSFVERAARHWGRDVNSLATWATTNREGEPVPLTVASLAKALARRPWNAFMKRLCFIAGDCFIKFQNHSRQTYGSVFVARKQYEVERNGRGGNAETAAAELRRFRVGNDSKKRQANEQGRLHDGHINDRARRYTAKLFLSHLHTVMYWDYYGAAPPRPWVFDRGDGDHRHLIPPPNFPWTGGGRPLRELLAD